MKKIPSLFVRDLETHLITEVVTPGCEWVINGEGVATVKFDGTSCLVRDRKLYRRYDAKQGKTPPPDFEPAQDEPDPITGHWPGWIPVGDGPTDQYHREAWANATKYGFTPVDGTWELMGPKVQDNPYGLDQHDLWIHGTSIILDEPRTFDGLREWLATHEIEGLVWWSALGVPDCDKCKIKRRDFGLAWPMK